LLFEGPDVDEFIEDLYSRLDTDAGKVEVYRVEPYEPAVEKQSRKLVYESPERFEAVQSFLNYLMSKLGGRVLNTPARMLATIPLTRKKDRHK